MIHLTKVDDGKLIAIHYHDIDKVEQFANDCTIQIAESGRIYHVQDEYSWIIEMIEVENAFEKSQNTKDARTDFIERFCIANPIVYRGNASQMLFDAGDIYDKIHNIQH